MQITFSQILGILSFVVTLLTTAASVLGTVKPTWAIYCLAVSAAISAFTTKIQGVKPPTE